MEFFKGMFKPNKKEGEDITKKEVEKSEAFRDAGKAALLAGYMGAQVLGNTIQASENESKTLTEEGTKTEYVAPNNIEPEIDPGTYVVTEEDFAMSEARERHPLQPESKNKVSFEYSPDGEISLDVTNSFLVDEAGFSSDQQENIQKTFQDFLSSIDKKNINGLLEKDWLVYASADERPTKAWDGGNEELSSERGKFLVQVLNNALTVQELTEMLSQKGLDQKQIDQVIEKIGDMQVQIPENGVTTLQQLINPRTGEHYTEAEIDTLKKNPKDLEEAYARAREVSFKIQGAQSQTEDLDLEMEKSVLETYPGISPEEVTLPKFEMNKGLGDEKFFEYLFEHGDKVERVILMDVSKSMSHEDFARAARSYCDRYDLKDFPVPLKIIPFSDQVISEKAFVANNPSDLQANIVALFNGVTVSGNEQLIQSAVEALSSWDNTQGTKTQVIFDVLSDEGIQDLSEKNLESLQSEMYKKGAQVFVHLLENSEDSDKLNIPIRSLSIDMIEKVVDKYPEKFSGEKTGYLDVTAKPAEYTAGGKSPDIVFNFPKKPDAPKPSIAGY